jgi:hypothetical protein
MCVRVACIARHLQLSPLLVKYMLPSFGLLLTVLAALFYQPDEYEKLGSYALCGLPDEEYKTK